MISERGRSLLKNEHNYLKYCMSINKRQVKVESNELFLVV